MKPEEAVKYPFKPADLERLEGPALAWVYRENQRLKLSQPLGAFADFWRELRTQRNKVLLVDDLDGPKLRLLEKPRRPASPGGRSTGRRRGEPSPENEVLCRMAPQSRFSPRAEPVTLARNYTTNPKTWEGLLRLEEINADRRRARAWWNANGAPDPKTIATPQLGSGASCSASPSSDGSSMPRSAMARVRLGRSTT